MLVEDRPQHVVDQPVGGAGGPSSHRATNARHLLIVAAAVVLAVVLGAFAGSRFADREAPSSRRPPTPEVITPARVVVAIPDLAGGRIAALKDRPAKHRTPSASSGAGASSTSGSSSGSAGTGSAGTGSAGTGSTGTGSTGGGSTGGGSSGGGSSGGGTIITGGGEN